MNKEAKPEKLLRLKAGYNQDATPTLTPSDVVNNKRFVTNNKSILAADQKVSVLAFSSPTLQYWHNELTSKTQTTRDIYEGYFSEFLVFVGKNPDDPDCDYT
jgi:hypothetical protein